MRMWPGGVPDASPGALVLVPVVVLVAVIVIMVMLVAVLHTFRMTGKGHRSTSTPAT
jgi:uncharacterized membrane protein